jgi:[calcium/calmodulin-dependent protein kinase] kinase
LLYTFDRSHVKIGDFGVSHFSYVQRLGAIGAAGDDPASQDNMDPFLLDDSALTMRAGTPMFIAPEVVWEYRIPTTSSSPSLARGQHLSPLPRSASIPDRSSVGGSSASPLSPLVGDAPSSGTNSPSSSSGRPPVTKAIDVWALGITFFCLLTGSLPYEASANEWALFAKIANQHITLPETLGVDRVPVAGRKVIDHDGEKGRLWRKSEGKQKLEEGCLIHELLEGLLQRDPTNRMALDDLKASFISCLTHHRLILYLSFSRIPFAFNSPPNLS